MYLGRIILLPTNEILFVAGILFCKMIYYQEFSELFCLLPTNMANVSFSTVCQIHVHLPGD